MTLEQEYCKKRHTSHRLLYLLYSYMTVFILILFFKNSSAAAAWVSRGLSLCVTRLIPSLFPFMVLSSLMVSTGAGAFIFKLLAKPAHALFGLSEHGTSALVLGWLCGFPVGAKCACELFRNGKIGFREYKIILCTSSTPSPAFLFGTLGKGMLGESSLGGLLYLISLLSSSAVGIFLNLTSKSEFEEGTPYKVSKMKDSYAVSLTHAIAEAGVGMLSVCAFVVFFSAFLGVLEGVLCTPSISERAMAVIFSFFEITSGLSRISALPDPLPLCALAVGWSGLSVHFQTMSICTGAKCSLSPYIIAQAVKAVLCFAIVLIIR